MGFPSLINAKIISIDVETKDPQLIEKGPSTFRGGGYICGISVATDDGFCEYFPVRHEGGGNLDEKQVFLWLKDQLSGAQPKLGANLLYDLEWLRVSGVPVVGGPKWDIQIAEALLDENRPSYSLSSIAADRLGEEKEEVAIVRAGFLRGIAEKDIKNNIWRLSGTEVAEYGKKDVLLPLRIWGKQLPILQYEGLRDVFNLETELIDVLLEMRFKGVRVDLERAAVNTEELSIQKEGLLKKLSEYNSGASLDIWSGKQIAFACDKNKLFYRKTDKGNPSFDAEWLSNQEHPFFQQVAEARLLDRAGAVFISEKILNEAIGGRIHCQYHPTRNDLYGTRSGRISCSNPNLQQVPARNEKLAKIIRSCFIPERGQYWASCDWSQIEPRLTVHYASLLKLTGGEEAAQCYRDNPATDYHQMTADMAEIERKPAKTLNLGLTYGMGPRKLSGKLGKSMEETYELWERYHTALPYVRLLTNRCRALAEKRGWVKTFLGRRSRFILWLPEYAREGDMTPLPRKEAEAIWGPRLKRHNTFIALNRVIQGSAAELMKLALVELHRKRLTPNLTIHDEVCKSVDSVEEALEIKKVMENIYKFLVPLKADLEIGSSWGEMENEETVDIWNILRNDTAFCIDKKGTTEE